MNIFLDVGGHKGQTVEEVLKPIYKFDVIHCFEPQLECCELMKEKFLTHIVSGRLILHNFGLSDFNDIAKLYGEGMGASTFKDKQDIVSAKSQECSFVSAAYFFDKYINNQDLVIMKLNCEGGEISILEDLIKNKK